MILIGSLTSFWASDALTISVSSLQLQNITGKASATLNVVKLSVIAIVD